MQQPRACANNDDIKKIQDLMRDGMRAFPHGYMHPMDLEWWFFYNPTGETLQDTTFLWEDEQGHLLAWLTSLITYGEYDLFMHPTQRGTALECEILLWIEERITRLSHSQENPDVESGSVFEDDVFRRSTLESMGYVGEPYLAVFGQSLKGELPPPELPEGYGFLPHMEERFAEQRAQVHVSAFINSRMTHDYYLEFMRTAPHYEPQHDVVTQKDGQLTSFAMTWRDDVLQWGEFEPVGTHQEHQRRGLGKATLQEGLHRLKTGGMKYATVCCHAPEAGTVAFYESAGFVRKNTTYRYRKPMKK